LLASLSTRPRTALDERRQLVQHRSHGEAGAALIAAYEAEPDLVLVVVTQRSLYMQSEPTFPAALERCGGSSTFRKIFDTGSGNYDWIDDNYVLVSQCSKSLGWAAAQNLERFASCGGEHDG